MPDTNKELARCYMCPIWENCYTETEPELTTNLKECPLWKLVAGEVKIETSGYLVIN